MLKIDYSRLPTEQSNPRSRNLDEATIEQVLHLMNREDHDVPRAVAAAQPQIGRAVRLISRALSEGGRLFFAGAGTSGRLGVLEAAECPPTFNTPPSMVQAVMAGGSNAVFQSKEGAEDHEEEGRKIFRKKLRAGDVVVGIAASGVTPFVRGALNAARDKNCKTVFVTCNRSKKELPVVDCLIALEVGPEIISGSTRLKAGTATKLVLNMLTAASMIRLGKIYDNWMVDLQPKCDKLKARGIRLIQHLGRVSELRAKRLLRLAKGNVKPAILMGRKRIDYKEAEARLRKCDGFLRKALEL